MDVAAPRGSLAQPVVPVRAAVAPAPAQAASASLPVRPAPLATTPQPTLQISQAPVPSTPPRAAKKSASIPSGTPRTPVALITVTVFVMLVLSVLAVTVYVTSQTA